MSNDNTVALLATDQMTIYALHVLVCNPAANGDLIGMGMILDPAKQNIHDTIPLDLFLGLKGIINAEHGISFDDV